MQQNFEKNEYDFEIEKKKVEQKSLFIIAKIMRVGVYLIKMLLVLTWGVIKGVLKTFGVPLKD